MFCLYFSPEPVSNFEQAMACEHDHFNRIFRNLLDEGIYLPPSSYETCFLSSAHGEAEVTKTLEALQRSFSKL